MRGKRSCHPPSCHLPRSTASGAHTTFSPGTLQGYTENPLWFIQQTMDRDGSSSNRCCGQRCTTAHRNVTIHQAHPKHYSSKKLQGLDSLIQHILGGLQKVHGKAFNAPTNQLQQALLILSIPISFPNLS